MKPSHLLFFVVACLFSLGFLALIFPKQGIDLGITKIQFPQISSVFSASSQTKVNIDSIAQQAIDSNTTIKKDTIMMGGKAIVIADTVRANPDSLLQVSVPIEFPNDSVEIFDKLFAHLQALPDSGGIVRMTHYGDSQIEADHITGMFRQLLQSRFGGYGCGLLPVFANNDAALPVPISQTGVWHRFVAFGKKDTAIHHNKFGPMLAISRFSPLQFDSTHKQQYKASIRIEKSNYAFARRGRYRVIKLFYGASPNKMETVFRSADSTKKTVYTDSSHIGVLRFASKEYFPWVSIQMSGLQSPDLFALSLEDSTGVLVDNVPLRGCSGLDFTRQSANTLRQMYAEMQPQLFILQFGVNVSKYGTEDYGFYEKALIKQINFLKSVCPTAAVLVIGISDISYKEGEEYVTNPTVEKIRDAQRNAAFATGSAFWDLYRAMGGKNSMSAWVYATQPLAQKDFTHFNATGANVVGKLLYNALIQQFSIYNKRKEAEVEK